MGVWPKVAAQLVLARLEQEVERLGLRAET